MIFRSTLFLVMALVYSLESPAEVIASLSTPGGPIQSNSSRNIGQSVTTPTGSVVRDLAFNFFGTTFGFTQGNASAEGELFLLSQEYLGVSDALSSSTIGFLAFTDTIQPDGSGLEWAFAPGTALQPNTQYFFYARNTGPQSGDGKAFTQFDPYLGGNYYQTSSGSSSSNFFRTTFNDFHFELEGTAVPEPSSILLGFAACTFMASRRRRN